MGPEANPNNTDAITSSGVSSDAQVHEESTPSTATTAVSDEDSKSRLDSLFNFVLLDTAHTEKVNEGNNGIILRLELENSDLFPTDAREGDEATTTVAGKLLKIYNSHGAGQREYDTQRAAYNLVEEAKRNKSSVEGDMKEDESQFASVPKPLLYHDLNLTPELEERLAAMGSHAHDRAEIILMDYVEGKDLATILYTELLTKHPKAAHLRHEHIEDWNMEDLQEEVARLFYYIPENNKQDTDALGAAGRLQLENVNILIRELGSIGVHVDPQIVTQIENTVELFTQQGLLLRDAHPRNFMVTGDIGSGGVSSMVDYGDAELLHRPVSDDDYVSNDGSTRYNRPENTIQLLRSVNASYEQAVEKSARNEKDPRESRLNAVLAFQKTFSLKNEKALGFSVSSDPTKNKVPHIEKAIAAAIDQYRETGEWDTHKLRRSFRDARGKLITQRREAEKKNILWNENALLSGIVAGLFGAVQNNTLNEEDLVHICEDLAKDSGFSRVLTDTVHWGYWRGWNFSEDLPALLVKRAGTGKNEAS